MSFISLLALAPLVAAVPHGSIFIPPEGPSGTGGGSPTATGGTITIGGPSGPGPSTPGPTGPTGPEAGPGADRPTTPGGRGPGIYAGPTGPVRTGGSGPSGPVAGPGAMTPIPASAPVTTPAVFLSATDLTSWDLWWHHNRDAFLDLRRAVRAGGPVTGGGDWFLGRGERSFDEGGLAPSEEQVRGKIVPALLAALRDERSNDVLTGALIALAKIGDGAHVPRAGGLADTLQAFLSDPNQEVSETAALALGILGNPSGVEPLIRLVRDDDHGRRLVGRGEVPVRTRAFAAYGLGLIGAQTEMRAVREWTARALVAAIADGKTAASDELEAAAVAAFGLVPLAHRPAGAPASSDGSVDYREDQVRFLLDLAADDRGEGGRRARVRAQAPRSLALLLDGTSEELRREVVDAFVKSIHPRSRDPQEVRQSCTLALGALGRADDADRGVRAALERAVQHGDELSKRFALIALARAAARPGLDGSTAGYTDVRARMLKWLASSGQGQSLLRPWVALALGQLERARAERGQVPHPDVVKALRSALEESRRPYEAGAYCLGLGLVRDPVGADAVREALERFSDDATRGYAAVALGLMDEWAAIEPLREIVASARYRPTLLDQAVTALGLLGDKGLVPELVVMLGEARSLSTQAALASALGRIGDKRAVDPLVELLQDRGKTSAARGFAAVALGIVAEKDLLPWKAKLAADAHYAAGTTTLTDATGTGVLDIL